MASNNTIVPDSVYPGTDVPRLRAIHARLRSLANGELNKDWQTVRKALLWAGGLRDLSDAVPGQGYTGHSFNDWNHCDLTPMLLDVADQNNQDGEVRGIALNNALGQGIRIASLNDEDLGRSGGSWSTCIMGCEHTPPRDVAHVQFRAKIAFKLVWVPPSFTSFVLVDDDGTLLARGSPSGQLPLLEERRYNFRATGNGLYSTAACAAGQLESASKS